MKYKPLIVHKKEHSTEKKIENAIHKLNGYVIKNQASHTTGAGKPDLSACIEGKYYGIEVKRDKGKVETTIDQIKNLQQIAKAGGFAMWAKSSKLIWLLKDKLTKDKIKLTNDYQRDLVIIRRLLNQPELLFLQYKIDDSQDYVICYYKQPETGDANQ